MKFSSYGIANISWVSFRVLVVFILQTPVVRIQTDESVRKGGRKIVKLVRASKKEFTLALIVLFISRQVFSRDFSGKQNVAKSNKTMGPILNFSKYLKKIMLAL